MRSTVPCGSNCIILLLSLSSSWGVGDYANDSFEDFSPFVTPTQEPLPLFSPHNPSNISVHLGSTAFLHCRVTLLNDKTVSWMKMDSPSPKLLTFGLHTYSKDARYSLNFEEPEDWKLRIERVEKQDEGYYKCQVSSYPPVAFHVRLDVVVPSVRMVDELGRPLMTDKYYNEGSTLELRCVISNYHPPQHSVHWRHGNVTLNVDGGNRGGISVKTMGRKEEGRGLSVLYIAKAGAQDSGSYICSVGGELARTSTIVHVIKGETPAAVHRTSSGTTSDVHVPHALTLFFSLTFLLWE